MYSKKQRIIATVGVIIILLLFAGLILSAVFDAGGMLFKAFLFASIAMPILLWIYIWLFGKLMGKKTIADFNLGKTGSDPLDMTPDTDEGLTNPQDMDEGQNSGSSDPSVTISKNPLLKR